MRWLGMTAAVLTLAAVVLNSLWFIRHGQISLGDWLRMSGPTVLYLALFIGGIFGIGWISARLLARLDSEGDVDDSHDEGAGGESDEG